MLATTPTSPQRTRLGSLLAGLSTLASIWPSSTTPLRYPHRDEAEALLADGFRIGDDMRVVIERERTRAQATAN
ncbi:hypothetical protein F8B43_1195 [Methylorubrum populi]|jgi:hypothetical protein|uniref:Uncharacterized protein n=1 Tax=Methylorubrum populi TaxID=223967 RepID=A0A833J7K4_9HYPH|nr:hypothetical protein F8B43_1195 [Methylorubrum populi]